MTTVVNIRTHAYDVYIGRAGNGEDGYYGNPFPLEDFGGDREACLKAFKNYFDDRIKTDEAFRKRVESLRDKRLGCFCVPHGKCHGMIYVEYLDGIAVADQMGNLVKKSKPKQPDMFS